MMCVLPRLPDCLCGVPGPFPQMDESSPLSAAGLNDTHFYPLYLKDSSVRPIDAASVFSTFSDSQTSVVQSRAHVCVKQMTVSKSKLCLDEVGELQERSLQ